MEAVHKITLPLSFGEKEVHTYLIEGEKLTLVDTGIKSRESWEVFQRRLHEIGYPVSDIKRVVLTHHHPDHCGMLDYFPDSVEVMAHPRNEWWMSHSEQFIKRFTEFFQQFGKEMGLPAKIMNDNQNIMSLLHATCKRMITTPIHEGDMISGFQVIETPGHASTHISLFRKEDGLLIGGDMLLAHITPNPLIEPPMGDEGERQKALLLYLHSLQKLTKMPIKKVLPGHGKEFENVLEVINLQLEKQQKRASRVMKILQGKQLTAFEISKELYPQLYKKQYALTLSQTIGQLDFLEYNNLVQVDKMKETWFYSLR